MKLSFCSPFVLAAAPRGAEANRNHHAFEWCGGPINVIPLASAGAGGSERPAFASGIF